MKQHNSPEIDKKFLQAFGEAIARLRSRNGWSCAKLLSSLHNVLSKTDPDHKIYNEQWIRNLEKGKVAKVPNHIIYALCLALNCDSWESITLQLLAGRNVIQNNIQDMTDELIAFHSIMADIYPDVFEIMRQIRETSGKTIYTPSEWREFTLTALIMVTNRNLNRKK